MSVRHGLMYGTLLLAATVPYMLDTGYLATSAETLVFAACAAVAGMLLGASCRKPHFERLLFALCAYWLADFYFLRSEPLAIVVLLAIYLTLIGRHARTARTMVIVFAAVFLVSALLTPRKPLLSPPLAQPDAVQQVANDAPPVIHLVLDEHISPAAVPAQLTGRADGLVADYTSRGFALYPSTRAASGATQFALRGVMGRPDPGIDHGPDFTHALHDARHLRALSEAGYTTTVIQSNFLRFCEPGEAGCHTYSRADHGRQMSRFDDALLARLQLALTNLHIDLSSWNSDRSVALYRAIGRHWPVKRHYWTRPAAMLALLDELEGVIGNPEPGHAYVAHVMLPHFPYVLDRGCGLKSPRAWRVPLWVRGDNEPRATVDDVYEAYWDQTACLHSRVMTLVDRILESPAGADATIVIHGDHGARVLRKAGLPDDDELDSPEPDEALDTLFAIRSPGIEPGVHPEPDFLQRRFNSLVTEHLDNPDPR